MQDRFITVEEIAQDLRVTEDTVRAWIRDGKLPAFKVGTGYRILKTEYEKFLQERRTGQSDKS